MLKLKTAIPLAAALAAFLALCALFSGVPDDAGFLASLSPAGAADGLAFALAYAVGIPETLAMACSVAVLVLVPVGVFVLVRRLLHRRAD